MPGGPVAARVTVDAVACLALAQRTRSGCEVVALWSHWGHAVVCGHAVVVTLWSVVALWSRCGDSVASKAQAVGSKRSERSGPSGQTLARTTQRRRTNGYARL
ncbi:hypothetical protein BN2475_90050 [Paraburkholderia ribeironis]|uniref:Uncharacterized protein n=1 Tax=Paraburkholderia ribeironis TaxID=1247936 RepID=A0A1N7RN07_9BURK|nr:hypothetical protein BN2475_90050 [Paraburkholderia ribeironis]